MAAFLKWISIGLAVLSPAPDNELYTGWANCKVGSWVKVKIINESTRLEMEVTFKLTDLSAEKAVVEGRGQTKVGGKTVDQPPQKTTIKAKDLPAGTLEQKGEEEIEIGDKKLKCRVVERVTKIGDSESRTKMWVSDEVPGGLVKSEVSSDGKVTTRNVVLSWEKKEKK